MNLFKNLPSSDHGRYCAYLFYTVDKNVVSDNATDFYFFFLQNTDILDCQTPTSTALSENKNGDSVTSRISLLFQLAEMELDEGRS